MNLLRPLGKGLLDSQDGDSVEGLRTRGARNLLRLSGLKSWKHRSATCSGNICQLRIRGYKSLLVGGIGAGCPAPRTSPLHWALTPGVPGW